MNKEKPEVEYYSRDQRFTVFRLWIELLFSSVKTYIRITEKNAASREYRSEALQLSRASDYILMSAYVLVSTPFSTKSTRNPAL
jgi:hypothetical protein